MREIKFRAFWNDTLEPVKDFNNEYLINACNGHIFKVSQYTGLKDKNGKDIYEGDIILNQWVEMRYGKWMCINLVDSENKYLFDWLQDNPENALVVGNIYENPELIK